MIEIAFVTSQNRTEFGLPCVGSCLKDFSPTEHQLRSLTGLLEGIENQTTNGIKYFVHDNSDRKDFFVYFMLPPGTSRQTIFDMKRKLAYALEDSLIATKVELAANINPRLTC